MVLTGEEIKKRRKKLTKSVDKPVHMIYNIVIKKLKKVQLVLLYKDRGKNLPIKNNSLRTAKYLFIYPILM